MSRYGAVDVAPSDGGALERGRAAAGGRIGDGEDEFDAARKRGSLGRTGRGGDDWGGELQDSDSSDVGGTLGGTLGETLGTTADSSRLTGTGLGLDASRTAEWGKNADLGGNPSDTGDSFTLSATLTNSGPPGQLNDTMFSQLTDASALGGTSDTHGATDSG